MHCSPGELTEVVNAIETKIDKHKCRVQFYIIKFEIGNENKMPRSRMKRACAHNFVTRSLQNINSSALDLASISHYSDEIERTGPNCSMRARRQPFKQLENVIEGDSSTPFWVS